MCDIKYNTASEWQKHSLFVLYFYVNAVGLNVAHVAIQSRMQSEAEWERRREREEET